MMALSNEPEISATALEKPDPCFIESKKFIVIHKHH